MSKLPSSATRRVSRGAAITLCLALAFFSLPERQANALGTFVVGTQRTTWENAQLWAARKKAAPEFVSLAPLFWQIAPTWGGVRPDVAYAQSAKETGYGKFGGVIDASFKNPCGLKITAGGPNDDPNAHQRFASWEQGITACVDHLALYAGAPGYPRADSPDPRHFAFLKGIAPTVESLGGKWAPSLDYGNSIIRDFLNPMIGPQSGFDEWILLLNPNAGTVTATVSAEQTGKAPSTRNLDLAPYSRSTVLVDELIADGDVSVRVTSSAPIVAERAMYFVYNGWDGGATSEGIVEPQTSWFLAEGYESDKFDTYVLLYNPGAVTATVTATFLREDGVNTVVSRTVPPSGRSTIAAAAVPGLEFRSFSVRIESSHPVLAERASYFKYGASSGWIEGGSSSPGIPTASTSWDLAEGYSGAGFDTWTLVANPNPTPANVRATYLTDAGRTVADEFTMSPNSRHTTLASALPGLAGTSHSLHLTSSAPVAVERAEYFRLGSVNGGATAQAVPAPALNWYLAEGYAGPGFDTWILLSNPSSITAVIEVNLYRQGLGPVAVAESVPPMSRKTLNLAALAGPVSASTFVRVQNGIPIVAERATYFAYTSPRGWKAAGGSGSMGVSTPASTWYFAEGYVW